MAEQLLHLELVTPEKRAHSGEVEMVVVPGALGDMGIMAWHAPIISPLRPGMIEVYEAGAVTSRHFVAGGYVEVHDNRCTVLAEELIDVALLSKSSLEAELEQLQRQLEISPDDAERGRLQQRLTLIEAKRLVAA